ncbi:hypothetical protein IGI04_012609 [Brassica rapa subsp. trilocularis]|uniref:Uncharacterized protein n=1 Tax=Brassica rapa subsp. trilocularis TaxID=1813537 RepID=A0ABQ7N6G5_BRACM|nr:hypothetical protein IGI04_012609 [Brassica rapa subsp. trilocularis]
MAKIKIKADQNVIASVITTKSAFSFFLLNESSLLLFICNNILIHFLCPLLRWLNRWRARSSNSSTTSPPLLSSLHAIPSALPPVRPPPSQPQSASPLISFATIFSSTSTTVVTSSRHLFFSSTSYDKMNNKKLCFLFLDLT